LDLLSRSRLGTVGGMTVRVGRIGVWVSSRFLREGEAAGFAAGVEELGYETLWIGAAPGDLRLVEEMLAATSRLTVATGIVNIWTEPAAVAAEAFARVSREHPDRLLLGIGAGHGAIIGERYRRPYQQLEVYLDELDAFEPPVPTSDRVLAALGPRVLGLARDRAAGAHPYLVTPEHTRQARAVLGSGPVLAPEQTVVLESDPDRARATARQFIGRYLPLANYTNNWRRLGFTDEDLADGGSDRLVDALVAWGDEEAILTRVRDHHAAGADHVCVQPVVSGSGLPIAELRALAVAGATARS
jgi:probable F420-dependent oxidoreductase